MTLVKTDDQWDAPPENTALGDALDRRIMELTSHEEKLTPSARLSLYGSLGTADFYHIEELTRGAGEPKALRKVPLEFMRFQSKDCLEEWEYLAGQRWRGDFDAANRSGGMSVDPTRGDMFDTDAARKHRAAGYYGKGASRNHTAVDITSSRIDAMHRRGEFAKREPRSAWLLDAVVGFEIWPKDIATMWGQDVRYVGPRFREALQDAASFYRIAYKAMVKQNVRAYQPAPGELSGGAA